MPHLQIEVKYPWTVNSETDIPPIPATGKIYAVMAESERKNATICVCSYFFFLGRQNSRVPPGLGGNLGKQAPHIWPHRLFFFAFLVSIE